MLFFNPSLRTRLSTQKAAIQSRNERYGDEFGANEGWTLEFEDGSHYESRSFRTH
jgi:N-succinyl-L-ornithine transcarbamylase